MLVPGWILAAEAFVLAVLMVKTYRKNRGRIGGTLALVMLLPTAYFIYAYGIADYVLIENARQIVRYGQVVFFLILIVIF